jgi:hypothetical protein
MRIALRDFWQAPKSQRSEGGDMPHFSSEKWADFVRNVLGQEEQAMMRGHLDTGCDACSEALAAWVRVREVAAREKEYQPPESVVRTVKGLRAIHGKSRRAAGVAALLFDSLLMPGAVGVRSAAGAARQMLYGVDKYRIDLRLEPKTDSDAISLVGQILISGERARPVGRTAVALLKGRRILSTSQTNEFGEFQLECDMATSIRLQFVLPEGRIIRTPIIELSEATAINIEVATNSSGVNARPSGNSRSTRNTV